MSYETVRGRVNHFGPMIAANLQKRRLTPHVAQNANGRSSAIGGRTTPHAAYALSYMLAASFRLGIPIQRADAWP